MLSRPFEQTWWHAIVITTLFWGGGEGAANIKSQEFLHLIVGGATCKCRKLTARHFPLENWKNEKLWKQPEGRNIFIKCRVFSISTSVDITEYLYGKMFYISFITWHKKIQNYFNG